MKHLIIPWDEKLYSSSILDFYFGNMNIGVFDIETTGLNPASNKFILGGLYNCQSKTLHQFFAENRNEEAVTLAAMMDELTKLDMVITYNGRHFDMPFVKRRLNSLKNILAYTAHGSPGKASSSEAAKLKDIAAEAHLPYDLDLYLIVNGHSPIRRFVPNLKQKTVENYMGLWQSRSDEISGAESVDLYNTYENTGDSQLENKILLHNRDDVFQLTRLLKVVSKCDFHKAMFHLGFPVVISSDAHRNLQLECREGPCVPHASGALFVEKIKLERDRLIISGKQSAPAIDYMGFAFDEYPVETRFESRNGTFTLKLPVIRDSGLSIADLEAAYVDVRDFERYPSYSSGFLVLQGPDGINHMEINHFVKAFLETFIKKG